MGFPWLQSPVAVYWRRSHCKLSGLTWFDIVWHLWFHRPLPKHWTSTRLWRASTCHGIALAMKEESTVCILSLYIQTCQGELQLKKLGSGFKDFYFHPYLGNWGRCPIWLIFFRLVETTNQIRYCSILFNTCMEYFSSFTSCRLHPLSPTSVLLPSHVRDSWKIWPNSWTPVQQHWCLRSLQHQ